MSIACCTQEETWVLSLFIFYNKEHSHCQTLDDQSFSRQTRSCNCEPIIKAFECDGGLDRRKAKKELYYVVLDFWNLTWVISWRKRGSWLWVIKINQCLLYKRKKGVLFFSYNTAILWRTVRILTTKGLNLCF